MPDFHIRVSGPDLIFSAAHFITLGDACERLHGHDYRVAAEVYGPLDENRCVVDFIAVRDALRAIIAELDHRVLLPAEHAAIRVAAAEKEIEVTFAERRWVFPREDCLILPVANTTAETLAQHVGERLLDELEARIGVRPALLQIEVEESPGLTAVCRLHA